MTVSPLCWWLKGIKKSLKVYLRKLGTIIFNSIAVAIFTLVVLLKDSEKVNLKITV